MELNIEFNKKMLDEMANRVLDEYEYNGKTIREWADLIAKHKTNADFLRSMSDEEFATAICTHDGCPFRKAEDDEFLKHHYDCKACWLDWLKAEVEENKT